MRTAILLLAVATVCVPASAQQPAERTEQQGNVPVFRKDVNVVNVFFTVKDKHGALMPNLSKDNFELFEEGKPQTIKYFSAESNQPLTLGLLIDSSLSMERMLPEEKVVAAQFLRQVVTDKDLAFVISFDISVDLLQDLTSNVHLLRSGLDKARINTNTTHAIPGNSGPVPTARNNQGTLLFDGVYLGADDILSRQAGRKAMIVLTDGEDQGSRMKLKDAIEAAQRADAICYVLLLSDPRYGSNPSDMGKLAEQTGGRLIHVDRIEKLNQAFDQLSAELRSQYSLGYSPTDAKNDGSFRRIEVRSKDGYKIQARKGYYRPMESPSGAQ